jgi:hypothetical protein
MILSPLEHETLEATEANRSWVIASSCGYSLNAEFVYSTRPMSNPYCCLRYIAVVYIIVGLGLMSVNGSKEKGRTGGA